MSLPVSSVINCVPVTRLDSTAVYVPEWEALALQRQIGLQVLVQGPGALIGGLALCLYQWPRETLLLALGLGAACVGLLPDRPAQKLARKRRARARPRRGR